MRLDPRCSNARVSSSIVVKDLVSSLFKNSKLHGTGISIAILLSEICLPSDVVD